MLICFYFVYLKSYNTLIPKLTERKWSVFVIKTDKTKFLFRGYKMITLAVKQKITILLGN
jgi:hypothetical protein